MSGENCWRGCGQDWSSPGFLDPAGKTKLCHGQLQRVAQVGLKLVQNLETLGGILDSLNMFSHFMY